MPDDKPVRIGILGAARIVHGALLAPAHKVPGVRVAAIAARDQDRAKTYATKHKVPRVHPTYDALLADPEIDAVYIPLPAALHAQWTLAAIEAGKHVLCEKPFTSNAESASRVASGAANSDRVVMEAYHTHYHPLHRRLREIVASGEIGQIHSAEASFCIPIPPGRDIRWNLALGGGGLLDVGYYPVRALTSLFGDTPEVEHSTAWTRGQIDRRMEATLHFGNGVRGEIVSSIWSRQPLKMMLSIQGDAGRIRVTSPYHPHKGGRIHIRGLQGQRIERTSRKPTYNYQLEAFRDSIQHRTEVETNCVAALRQLQTLDALYSAAGLEPRP
jgi:predicted dehydrogenase